MSPFAEPKMLSDSWFLACSWDQKELSFQIYISSTAKVYHDLQPKSYKWERITSQTNKLFILVYTFSIFGRIFFIFSDEKENDERLAVSSIKNIFRNYLFFHISGTSDVSGWCEMMNSEYKSTYNYSNWFLVTWYLQKMLVFLSVNAFITTFHYFCC